MAALTRSLGAYVQFRNYTLCFVGGLHLLIGAMFVYFGIQVGNAPLLFFFVPQHIASNFILHFSAFFILPNFFLVADCLFSLSSFDVLLIGR